MNAPFLAILAVITCFSCPYAFAQEQRYKTIEEENFQRYDSLEREALFMRKPLLAFGYHNLKTMGTSHASIVGIVSTKYLPEGLPQITDNTMPLADVAIGWGLKMFLGNVLYNWFFDYGRATWQIPPQTAPEAVRLASLSTNLDLGYAVWKNETFLLTPCINMGFSGYTLDTNRSWRIYTGRTHLGGAVDMSYFTPLLDSPFHSLEQRKLGIQEIIEAMVSVRLGYAQHFENGFTKPTHQEFSMRVMVGIGTRKFVED